MNCLFLFPVREQKMRWKFTADVLEQEARQHRQDRRESARSRRPERQ
jgi:hypothetical protein